MENEYFALVPAVTIHDRLMIEPPQNTYISIKKHQPLHTEKKKKKEKKRKEKKRKEIDEIDREVQISAPDLAGEEPR